jgi:hypothetical protein
MSSFFGEEALKIMQRARDEAQRFNHSEIRTEHILLALVFETYGRRATIFAGLGLDFGLCQDITALMERGPDAIVGFAPPLALETMTALRYAIDEARRVGDSRIGAEHILLGLLREQDGLAARVLKGLGIELDDLRPELLQHRPKLELTIDQQQELTPDAFRPGSPSSRAAAERFQRRPQADVVKQLRKEWEIRNDPVVRLYLRARDACYRMLSSPDQQQRQWAHDNLEGILLQLRRLYESPPRSLQSEARLARNRRALEWKELNSVVRLDLVNQAATYLTEANSVLLVGNRGSGRRTVASLVAKAMASHSGQLVTINHLGLAVSDRDYRDNVRALSNDLVHTRREIAALPELHSYVDVSWGRIDFADVWKVFLRTLLDNRAQFLAWTTPDGIRSLRDAWPGIIERLAVLTLDDLPEDSIHDVLCEHLRSKCEELGVSLEDGFVGQIEKASMLWRDGREIAEPGRTVSLANHVLNFDRATFSKQEESAERAELRATYLKHRETLQRAISANRSDVIDSLLPTLIQLRDQLGGRMALATRARRVVSTTQIAAFLGSR